MEALDLRDVAVEVIGDVAFGGTVVLQGVACVVADIAEPAEGVIEGGKGVERSCDLWLHEAVLLAEGRKSFCPSLRSGMRPSSQLCLCCATEVSLKKRITPVLLTYCCKTGVRLEINGYCTTQRRKYVNVPLCSICIGRLRNCIKLK